MTDINIGGTLHSVATGNVVARAEEILDREKNKKQDLINQETDQKIGALEEAVGTGGSIDARIEVAVGAETQRATEAENARYTKEETYSKEEADAAISGAIEDCAYLGDDDGQAVIPDFDPQADTLWKGEQILSNAEKAQVKENLGLDDDLENIEGEISTLGATVSGHTTAIELLQELYRGLSQSDIVVVDDHTAVVSPEENTIYREPGVSSYTDWMYYNGAWEEMATYNNAVDDKPTASSNNLVKSGGVYDELALGAVFDVTAHNSNTTFASLDALLSDANLSTLIPAAVRKGGMSIKFVLTSSNKYVQYRYMSTSIANADFVNVANWQGVDDVPVSGSHNLVEGGGVADALEGYIPKEDVLAETVGNSMIFQKDNGDEIARIDENGIHTESLFIGDVDVEDTISPLIPSISELAVEGIHINDDNNGLVVDVKNDGIYAKKYYVWNATTEEFEELKGGGTSLSGKTIIFDGDSITYAGSDNQKGFCRAAEELDMTYTNNGKSGWRTSDIADSPKTGKCLVNVVAGHTSHGYDYIIVTPSISNDVPYTLGELSSTFIEAGTTPDYDRFNYYGALELIARDITTRFDKCGMMIPYKNGNTIDGSSNSSTLKRKAIRDVCQKWGIPLLDLSECAGFNLVSMDLRRIYGVSAEAPAYDPTSGYDIDDVVSYNDIRYKCLATIPAPAGTFDAELWENIGGQYDNTHCNSAAYILMKNKVKEFIKSI